MTKYFGTDGFRGEANLSFTVEHAYKIGRFLGWYYGKGKKARIIIGKDTRRSCDMFEAAIVSGLTASGADVYLLKVTTTPNVSYTAREEEFDCGIMISASHNLFYDNGIKIVDTNGHKLDQKIIDLIEDYIDNKEAPIPFAAREGIGSVIDFTPARDRYMEYLISIAKHSFKDKKVGLDCSNGSASTIAKAVFHTLGAKTFVINNLPDGLNINANCGSTNIKELQKHVINNGLDVGFAYDGDADRCIAVDNKGRVIDGDLILYVCGYYMKECGELINNMVVTTVMSNIGLYKALDKVGIAYEKTDVGDKYVYENIVSNGHCIGGEQSGHIIFSKHAATGDGILTSLKIMEVMLAKNMTLSDLAKDVSLFPQLLVNVEVHDKKAAQEDKDVINVVEKISSVLGEEGRILFRKSGTEPKIRVMVEAVTEDLCSKYVNEVLYVLKAKGHVVGL
jgi:phosphoglucosamine mutase